MITVTEAVKQQLLSDQISLEALRQDILNLRAYASRIQKSIQDITMKDVQIGTIVVTLSRIAKNLELLPEIKPEVKIENLSIKSDLTVINYEKTNELLQTLSQIKSLETQHNDFFVIVEGLAEISIIASDQKIEEIIKTVKSKPKSKFGDAIALTIRFSDRYVTIPNVLYNFASALAVKRVNLFEIVSTLTEVSFIIHKKDMNDAIDTFKTYLEKE